ncbi:uncharacterized protein LOC131647462 [Vicia villosa]|uniref:uncharacterized protein LOC131647462 n=1 Tax=Vicia villosa TaxID=3911 RepID=UPI00273B623B|nr:uncharacterized protein LOC131647462 [Vicia villosa]
MNFKILLFPSSPLPRPCPSPSSSNSIEMGYDQNPFTIHTNSLSKNNYSSLATNNFTSHAIGITKAMRMLEVQFGSSRASPSKNNNEDVIKVNNIIMNASKDSYHPNLHGSSSSLSQGSLPQTINFHGDDVTVCDNNKRKRKKINENIDDGRIHSLPFKKYGPYTCPKCYKVLNTSKKFASHVASTHYKFESEEERKKRYMFKMQKRSNLRIQKPNDETTTIAHVDASSNQPHLITSINEDDKSFVSRIPTFSGVIVKLEPKDD